MTLVRVTELYYAKPTYRTVVELNPIALVSFSTPAAVRFQSGLVAKAFIATGEIRGFTSIEEKELQLLAGFDVRFLMPTE